MKSNLSFYISVNKNDAEQPDWEILKDDIINWISKSRYEVFMVSKRETEDYNILEISGSK